MYLSSIFCFITIKLSSLYSNTLETGDRDIKTYKKNALV